MMSRVRTAVNELSTLRQKGQEHGTSQHSLQQAGDNECASTFSSGHMHTDGTFSWRRGEGREDDEKLMYGQIVTILGANSLQQVSYLSKFQLIFFKLR
jgi:hypothetical protein